MDGSPKAYRATVIVSVYHDVPSLACILAALARQSEPRFQTIISEDGQSDVMRLYLESVRGRFPHLQHVTQEDRGFRKTAALNQAVRAADASQLLFIDGDCVPHRRFVECHLRAAEAKTLCAGRRVQLGPRVSRWLRAKPARVAVLQHRTSYLMMGPLLALDGTRNYEIGLASPLLNALASRKRRNLLGCNFSCAKEDLLAINGFNEDFFAPGGGEDDDIEWRMARIGVRLKSVRFSAPVFHLHHPSNWRVSPENQRILQETAARDEFYCRHGLKEHTP
jgi:hypothetical protein